METLKLKFKQVSHFECLKRIKDGFYYVMSLDTFYMVEDGIAQELFHKRSLEKFNSLKH